MLERFILAQEVIESFAEIFEAQQRPDALAQRVLITDHALPRRLNCGKYSPKVRKNKDFVRVNASS